MIVLTRLRSEAQVLSLLVYSKMVGVGTYEADKEHAECLDCTAEHEGFASAEGVG